MKKGATGFATQTKESFSLRNGIRLTGIPVKESSILQHICFVDNIIKEKGVICAFIAELMAFFSFEGMRYFSAKDSFIFLYFKT